MRNLLLLAVILFFSFQLFAQDGLHYMMVNKTKTNNDVSCRSIYIEGQVPEELYLAASVKFPGGHEFNNPYDIKDVITVKGDFTAQMTLPFGYEKKSVEHGQIWVISLWKRRVEYCGCEYCKKNGFHLEDRVDKIEHQKYCK